RRVAVGPLGFRRVAVFLHAEDGATLAEPNRLSRAAAAGVGDFRLVLVTEQMRRETPGRRDLRITVLLSFRRQPIRPLVREQQADVVLLRPGVHGTITDRVKLAGIPDQPALVISAGQLEERGVQPHDADLVFY